MKAIVIDGFGGVEKLKLTDIAKPIPSENEVLIKINYTSINPVDWKIREGYLKKLPFEFPLIPGWDAAGIIADIGKNVDKFKINDEIFAFCRKPVVQWGTYAEYIVVDQNHVAKKPKNINFAQAASIPLTGLTAWQTLVDFAQLRKGETVLIHAGAGGVGGMAIQLARNIGAKIITTASQNNHPYVKKLGADEAIDYTLENFVNKVKQLAPQGVDVLLDAMGGEVLKESVILVKDGGRIVSIVQKPELPEATARKIQLGYVFVAPNGYQLEELGKLIEESKLLAPHIEEMDLTEAASAQEKIRQGHTRGKIVLKIDCF